MAANSALAGEVHPFLNNVASLCCGTATSVFKLVRIRHATLRKEDLSIALTPLGEQTLLNKSLAIKPLIIFCASSTSEALYTRYVRVP